MDAASTPRSGTATWLIRLIGLGLLAWLLVRLDLGQAAEILVRASPGPLLLAGSLLPLLIGLKTLRWLRYLDAGTDWRRFGFALRTYFGGLFVGFVTPGRLGEFARAYFVRDYVGGSVSRALLTVLVDRLFDLGALLAVGGLALRGLPAAPALLRGLAWPLLASALLIPAAIELAAAGRLRSVARVLARFRWTRIVERLLEALDHLPRSQWLPASALTAAAYLLFFWQGLLLAQSLGLPVGFGAVAQCLALAGLAALLPISISGLGTREWVVTLYLGAHGLQPEQALAFSGLIFLTFNLLGGLLGAVAWLTLPERPPLVQWRSVEPGLPGTAGNE